MKLGVKSVIFSALFLCLVASVTVAAQEMSSRDKNLLQAISKKDGEKALRLLRNTGVSANITDPSGRTALMNAVAGGLTEVVKDLLERGAEVNVKSKEGQTALMLAADFGHTEAVRLLLAKGADCKAKDQDDWTALQYATMRVDAAADQKKKNYEEIIRILKEAEKPPATNAANPSPAPVGKP
jgi:ankyrin repeat protein